MRTEVTWMGQLNSRLPASYKELQPITKKKKSVISLTISQFLNMAFLGVLIK